jgi:hypothetical protein
MIYEVTWYNVQVASLNTSLPFPMLEQETLVEMRMSDREEQLWQPVTPHADCTSNIVAQSCVIRGISKDRVKRFVHLIQVLLGSKSCKGR